MLEIINTVVVLRIKIADSLHSDMGPTIARKAPDCQTHTLSPCQPYLASVDFESKFLIVSRKVIFYLSFLFQVCGCWCWWEEKIVLKLLSWCESSITKRVWMAKVLPCVKISTMPSAPYWRIGAIWCAAPSLGNAGKLCRRETSVNI